MAKRQSASLPNYGPNTALIEGAKLVYGTQNQAVKPIKIDMSGADALRQRADAYRQEQTAKINKEETKMANYLANMNYMDTGVVPENYLPQVQAALKEYKDEYFQASQQLSQLKSTDPEYQNLNLRLLEINNGIKSIANTFTDQKENKKTDLLMFDPKNNKKLSILNDAKVPGIVEGIGSILRNEAPMKIENGVVKYELNGEWVKYEDIPELQYRADEEAEKIGTVLSKLSTSTPKEGLTSEQLANYRNQIGNMLNNQDVMMSLALDDFEGYDLGLGLSAYEIQQNPAAAKELMLDKYMSMVEAAAKTGQRRFKGGGSGGRGRSGNIPSAWGRLFDTLATNPNGSVIDATLAIPGVDVDPRKYKVNWDKNGITFMDPVTKEKIDVRMEDLYTGMWGLDLPDYFKPTGTTNTSATPVIGLPGNEMKQGPTLESGAYDTL